MPEAATLEAPPAPSPAAPAAAAKAGEPTINFDSAFADLEKIARPDSAEPAAPAKSPTQQAKEKREAAELIKKEPENIEDEPAAPAKDEPKPTEPAKPEKPKKPADFLRDELTKTKQERDSFKAELEKARVAPKIDDGETKKFTERITKLEKDLQERDQTLSRAAYENSPEFKRDYLGPYQDAFLLGRETIAKFSLTDAEGATRKATAEDFDQLISLYIQDPDRAAAAVNDLFGNKSGTVNAHLIEVQKQYARMQRAKQEGDKALTAQRELETKQHGEWRERVGKRINSTFEAAYRVADQKFPELFGLSETDAKEKEIYDKAVELSAKAFGGASPYDPKLSDEQRDDLVAAHAAVWRRSAQFPVLARRLKQASGRIAELEKELKQFKASEPDTTAPRRPNGSIVAPDTMDGVLGQLDKKARAI
jgi:hypothetical protein